MFIPYGKHYIDKEDIEAVVQALQADYIATGPGMEEFEKAFAEYVGAKYAVSVSSGTAALHASCYALGIGERDEVITTPITFVSTASSVLFCGGSVVFADIDADTYNIDPDDVERKITKRTKAIIPVHYTGQPCEMKRIYEIARKHGLKVIEDAAHAHGADYQGDKIGSCKFSDLTAFSFHPVKLMTTCEGGMVTTNDEALYQKMKLFRAYCSTKDAELLKNRNIGPWYYEVQGLGYNYRLSDVMCALGKSQLRKLDQFVEKRRDIAKRYQEELNDLEEIVLPYQREGCNSSWHLYVIQIKNINRKNVYMKMREAGIGVDVHYLPVYKHPYFQENGYKNVYCANAENLYSRILSIPIYYGLDAEKQTYVIKTIKTILQHGMNGDNHYVVGG